MEDVTKIYSQFKQVGQQVEIIRNMYGKAKELDELTGENVAFTEEAYKLLDTVKEFVSLVEESDTNLDPEKTKLEGVDNLFKGHFVTDHVNNVLNEVYNSQGVPSSALGENKNKPYSLLSDKCINHHLRVLEEAKDYGEVISKPCCDECTNPCPCEGKQPEVMEVKCLGEGECKYPLCICAIGK